MLVDRAENPEPNETTPTSRVPVRTRAVTQRRRFTRSTRHGAVVVGA
jgi:hypothetical protein